MELEKKKKRMGQEREYRKEQEQKKQQEEEERELRIINARITRTVSDSNRSLSPTTTRRLSQRAIQASIELESLTKEQYALQQAFLAAKKGSPEKSMLSAQNAEIDKEIEGAVERHQRYIQWERWNNGESKVGGASRSDEWPEVTEEDLITVIENWERKQCRRAEREAYENTGSRKGSLSYVYAHGSVSPVKMELTSPRDPGKCRARPGRAT